ncbi:MAG: ester cyclase [Chloroflexi bacterium]|nr:ester cyclase [Chloroflexota bacterium]
MSVEQNKALLRRGLLDMWSTGDLSILEELIAPDYVMHDVAGDFRGIEAYKQFLNLYRGALQDLRFTIDDQVGEGDLLATRWTSSGTHQGELMGIPPTGKLIAGMGIVFSHIVNGKAVEEWGYWDAFGLLQQLGAAPARGRTDFSWGEPSKVTGDPGDPESNKAIVTRYVEEAWNQQRLDVLDEIMHADVVTHEPITGQTLPGREGRKQAIRIYVVAFPDLHSSPNHLIAEGDKVALHWTATATHQGELMGTPPTGKKVKWSGVAIFRIADGQIVETWWSWDTLGLLQQIGAIPAAGQGGSNPEA